MQNSIETSGAVDRRSFLKGLGGMAFCVAVGTDSIRIMSEAQAAGMANALITPWVRIAPDGAITILTAGAEMGQPLLGLLRYLNSQLERRSGSTPAHPDHCQRPLSYPLHHRSSCRYRHRQSAYPHLRRHLCGHHPDCL